MKISTYIHELYLIMLELLEKQKLQPTFCGTADAILDSARHDTLCLQVF